MRAQPFAHLFHADWSAGPKGRWVAEAVRQGVGWRADAPYCVPPPVAFVDRLFAASVRGPVLAGFDFPIGLPAPFGRATGLPGFPDALDRFGAGAWSRFYDVAAEPGEVGPARPFYPARPGNASHRHLLDGHGAATLDALMRRCERGGPGRRAAGCLFWTLGPAQVGKAAMAGWREVVGPARRRGAWLWPFDGTLADLAGRGGVTLAETYPADAYARLGAPLGPGQSKRRRSDRAGKADAMLSAAGSLGIAPSEALVAVLRDGFGEADKGGDAFDAVAGLLAMVRVVGGHDAEGAPRSAAVTTWEGWILGRQA